MSINWPLEKRRKWPRPKSNLKQMIDYKLKDWNCFETKARETEERKEEKYHKLMRQILPSHKLGS